MNKVTLVGLQTLAESAKGSIDRIYLHWSAGHYTQYFDDYHININGDGEIYASTDDLTEHKSHTWHRNSRAIGVSLCCCCNATSDDLGSEPPTTAQIESMAQVIAVLCKYLELPCDYSVVRTHGEQGDEEDPGYGQSTTCERWDLALLRNGDAWGSGGNTLRGKGNYYIAQGSL